MAEDAPSSTRKIIVIVVGVVIAVAVALGGMGVVTGVLLRGETSAHPPCDQLPAVTEVEDALAAHPPLSKNSRILVTMSRSPLVNRVGPALIRRSFR